MDYAIELENVSKRFGRDYTALDDVSVKIRKGDIVGYVGPNGAGKTTTIKILTNLISPSEGSAFINGEDVNKEPTRALASVGALIEVPGLYDYLTPREMFSYFGKVYGMDKGEVCDRTTEVMEMVKLSGWEDSKMGSFSTGMQRRTALAKAIFHNPEVLILDEPVIGLDPAGIRDVRELIKAYQKEGNTIFLSSHLLQEVSETCDSAVFIENGSVISHDSIANILHGARSMSIDMTLLEHPTESELEIITANEHVKDVCLEKDRILITYDGRRESGSSILEDAVRSGLKVFSYSPQTFSLEDYYLATIRDTGEGR